MYSKKLKIVFLTADCSEQGTYLRFHNIARGLVELGHVVSIFCVDFTDNAQSRTETRDDVLYSILKCSKGKSVFGSINHPITSLRRVFDNFPACDIVHVFQPFLSVYLPWKFNLKKKATISFFDWDDLWVDDLRDREKRNFQGKWDYKLKGLFEKKIPATNHNMTVCSNFLKRLAIERGASQVEVVPNGCWEYEVPGKLLSRQKLGLREDAAYMGFMGRTGFELHWCFDALEECIQLGIPVRFALCGPKKDVLEGIPPRVLESIDYLGNLTPMETRYFAAAMDLGLLPLMKTEFNESRFLIKFAEYMVVGLSVLCSEVGEMNGYGKNFPWVIKAGTTQPEWTRAFVQAAKMVMAKQLAKVDRDIVLSILSWKNISKQMEQLYLQKLSEKINDRAKTLDTSISSLAKSS